MSTLFWTYLIICSLVQTDVLNCQGLLLIVLLKMMY